MLLVVDQPNLDPISKSYLSFTRVIEELREDSSLTIFLSLTLCRQFAGPVAPSVMVVGTKLDLVEVGCKREVTQAEARELADSLGALYMGN